MGYVVPVRSRLTLVVVTVGLACSPNGLKAWRQDAAEAAGGAADSGVGPAADAGRIDSPPVPIDAGLCGNGIFDPGEGCDDGNTTSGDGCSKTCQLECDFGCGPPMVDLRVCGNGILTVDEECDDDNNKSGDGCSESCQIEPGWRCPAPGRRCLPVCGDGKMVGWETCDDGNTVDGDGCASNCLVEPCWDCTSGSCFRGTCADGGQEVGDAGVFRCGDGILSPGEECDDGNAYNTDGLYGTCTKQCKFGPFCGDGQVNGPEQCDLGKRNGLDLGQDGCTYGCIKPRYCGDGVVDTDLGEECDLGVHNGVKLDAQGKPSDTGTIICDSSCRILPIWMP